MLSEKNQELKKTGEDVIEIKNRIGRIEAVLKEEYKENLAIAKFPEKTYHRKQVQKNVAHYSVALYL